MKPSMKPDMTPDMRLDLNPRWFVAHTQPNAEAKAVAHLHRQGFDVYWPRYLKRRRHARKIETVAAPLFPRYVFVAVDLAAQRWRSICSTVGVARLVCNGEDPAAVPDGVVAALRGREDVSGFIKLDSRTGFRPGEKVRVLDGAFSSCLGLFEGMADRERIAILLDLLGRKVRVVLDADLVAAA
jgi:transcriptional antiterminator RfaH